MKINKSNFGWIFTCCGLLILLGIVTYLGASGWFFKNDLSYTTDLELGKTITTSIKKNQAQSISLTFDGSLLPGEHLPQIVGITNSDDSEALYIRAKVYVYNGDNIMNTMGIVETINWTYNEDDGYYYFNELLSVNTKVALCSYVVVGEDSAFIGKNKYILSIVFESLSQSLDVEAIWGTNPLENVWQKYKKVLKFTYR